MNSRTILILLTLFLAGTSYAQRPDTELLPLAKVGGFSLSGLKVQRNFEARRSMNKIVTFDSTFTDTTLFSRNSYWSEISDSMSSWSYPNFQFLKTETGETVATLGFGCQLDTVHRMLLSLHCINDYSNSPGETYTANNIELTLDSIPYILHVGATHDKDSLSATLQGSALLRKLQKFSAMEQSSGNSVGLSFLTRTTYVAISDSALTSAATFVFYLKGPATAGVELPSASHDALTLYPNPCSSVLNVSVDSANESLIKTTAIYDQLGRKWSVPLRGRTSHGLLFDVQSLPAGAYHLVSAAGSNVFTVVK